MLRVLEGVFGPRLGNNPPPSLRSHPPPLGPGLGKDTAACNVTQCYSFLMCFPLTLHCVPPFLLPHGWIMQSLISAKLGHRSVRVHKAPGGRSVRRGRFSRLPLLCLFFCFCIPDRGHMWLLSSALRCMSNQFNSRCLTTSPCERSLMTFSPF